METLFIIHSSRGGMLYAVFYNAAFLVSAGIFIYEGIRRRYPPRSWLVLSVLVLLFCIIGNKASTIGFDSWKQWFNGQPMPGTGRSVLGCIAGLIAGVFIARRLLLFEQPVIDHLAYALPAGMAITRLGCLFGGCCYGMPTRLPWGIQYGAGSRAFHQHFTASQIPPASDLSLPVHPTQLYDALGCILIILLVWLTRKRWKAGGSRFLFAVTCYLCLRFALEFLRQSPAGHFIGEPILGLKILQWILLAAALMLAAFLVVREKRPVRKAVQGKVHQPSLYRETLVFAIVPVFLVVASRWLDPFEKSVIWIFAIPVLLILLYEFYSRLTVREIRWKVPVIMLIAGITMSQVADVPSTATAEKKYRGWLSIAAYGGLGSYPDKQFDCEGNLTDIYTRDYYTYGAGLGYHYKPRADQHLTASFSLYATNDWTNVAGEEDYSTPALNLWVGYNSLYVGGTLGMNAIFDEYWISDVVPVGSVWVGKRDVLFMESNFMTDFNYLGPPGMLQVGLGSGFGNVDRDLGKLGFSIYPGSGFWGDRSYIMGGYLSGDFLVKNALKVRGNLFFGRNFGGSLGIEYHVGRDKWTSREKNKPPRDREAGK